MSQQVVDEEQTHEEEISETPSESELIKNILSHIPISQLKIQKNY